MPQGLKIPPLHSLHVITSPQPSSHWPDLPLTMRCMRCAPCAWSPVCNPIPLSSALNAFYVLHFSMLFICERNPVRSQPDAAWTTAVARQRGMQKSTSSHYRKHVWWDGVGVAAHPAAPECPNSLSQQEFSSAPLCTSNGRGRLRPERRAKSWLLHNWSLRQMAAFVCSVRCVYV